MLIIEEEIRDPANPKSKTLQDTWKDVDLSVCQIYTAARKKFRETILGHAAGLGSGTLSPKGQILSPKTKHRGFRVLENYCLRLGVSGLGPRVLSGELMKVSCGSRLVWGMVCFVSHTCPSQQLVGGGWVSCSPRLGLKMRR